MGYLQMRGVSKRYVSEGGKTREVLRDVNLSVERGEFVSVVGCSGAGKTTLLSILAGLIAADSGTVTIGGRAVTGPGPDRSVVFQSYALLPWLDVTGNVALGVERRFPNWTPVERRRWVELHLDKVGLLAARRKKPAQLSGGMRQRVAIARALAMDPEVLLLDEPLSALDALTRVSLQEEIERIWRESQKTVVMITNDISESVLLSDRIVPLGGGTLAGATLGAAIPVTLERPRRARALHHDPRAQALCERVVGLSSVLRQRQPGLAEEPLATLSPLAVNG